MCKLTHDFAPFPACGCLGQIIPRLDTAVPLLIERLRLEPQEFQDKVAIAFPDEGACKRFGSGFPGFRIITAIKVVYSTVDWVACA